MQLVRWCESRGMAVHTILRVSVLLLAASFAVMNLVPTVAFLWVGVLFMTVGEMLLFPFTNRMANERADRGQPGAYMALYTIAWSVAHIIGHSLGLNLIAWSGFANTWWLFTGVLVACVGMLYALERMMAQEPRNTGP
jgi:predicted MFS family arabinose efflux permease